MDETTVKLTCGNCNGLGYIEADGDGRSATDCVYCEGRGYVLGQRVTVDDPSDKIAVVITTDDVRNAEALYRMVQHALQGYNANNLVPWEMLTLDAKRGWAIGLRSWVRQQERETARQPTIEQRVANLEDWQHEVEKDLERIEAAMGGRRR